MCFWFITTRLISGPLLTVVNVWSICFWSIQWTGQGRAHILKQRVEHLQTLKCGLQNSGSTDSAVVHGLACPRWWRQEDKNRVLCGGGCYIPYVLASFPSKMHEKWKLQFRHQGVCKTHASPCAYTSWDRRGGRGAGVEKFDMFGKMWSCRCHRLIQPCSFKTNSPVRLKTWQSRNRSCVLLYCNKRTECRNYRTLINFSLVSWVGRSLREHERATQIPTYVGSTVCSVSRKRG